MSAGSVKRLPGSQRAHCLKSTSSFPHLIASTEITSGSFASLAIRGGICGSKPKAKNLTLAQGELRLTISPPPKQLHRPNLKVRSYVNQR